MEFAGVSPKRLVSAGVVVACAVGLSGCFDLAQKVAIGRDGSGGYQIAVVADGLIGEGLSRDHGHGHIHFGEDMPMHRAMTHEGDKTVETIGTAFHDFSDLKLDDETLSLHVKGSKLLGLMGTQVNFHRSIDIDHARHLNDDDGDGDHLGHEVLTSIFGDHTYTYSVWLPGTIDHITPVSIDGHLIQPQVTDAGDGHWITWKMTFTDLLTARNLAFDVDFTSRGNFHDTQSQAGDHRHHHDDT
jgi:hypothetical protein